MTIRPWTAILVACLHQVLLCRGQGMNVTGDEEVEVEVQAGTLVMSAVFNSSAEAKDDLTARCTNETGASQEDADAALRMEIPSSEAGKCLTKCLLKPYGVMTTEGAFSPNATVDLFTLSQRNESLRAEFQKLADYCYDKLKVQPMSNLDTCDFAFDIATCTEEYHKTLFLKKPEIAPPVNAITAP